MPGCNSVKAYPAGEHSHMNRHVAVRRVLSRKVCQHRLVWDVLGQHVNHVRLVAGVKSQRRKWQKPNNPAQGHNAGKAVYLHTANESGYSP